MAEASSRAELCQTRSPSHRREEILEIAAAVFATKGVAGSTVRDIADSAGILSGSLYHHFETKDQIVEEIVRPMLEQTLVAYRSLSGPPDEVLSEMLELALVNALENRNASLVMQNEYPYMPGVERFATVVALQNATRATWTEVLARGVDQGVLNRELDIDTTYLMIMGAVATTVRWGHLDDMATARDLARRIATVLLYGLLDDRRRAQTLQTPSGQVTRR